MKIRNGFVSNSSSSSFIIALKSRPKNKNEVRELFFNGKSEDDIFNNECKIQDVVEDLWLQIKNWDGIYEDKLLLREMEGINYCSGNKKRKPNKKFYFGVDEKLFEEFQEIEKDYYKLCDKEEELISKSATKEEMIVLKNNIFKSEVRYFELLNLLKYKDLYKFLSDNINKGYNQFLIIRFSNGGWDYSPLVYDHSWLKGIPCIEINNMSITQS